MSSSERLKNLKYRTLEDLLNEVRVDLYAFSQDNSIQPAELIKVVQKCNYELGLKIHQTKEAIIDIEHRTAKLPADFHILNFGMLCHKWVDHPPKGMYPTGYSLETLTTIPDPNQTDCPCWKVVSTGAQTKVTYCDGVVLGVFFPANDDASPKTTYICARSIDTENVHGGTITATTSTFCYRDNNDNLTCTQPDPCACNVDGESCDTTAMNHWNDTNRVYTVCDGVQGELKVYSQSSGGCTREYHSMEWMQFVTSKYASAFCSNNMFPQSRCTAQIKNDAVYANIECGKLYINYQGLLEDDDGNLLVLDHPQINEYYEYAIKARILENLYLNDSDAQIERKLMYVKGELRIARANALSIANTPEVAEMREAYTVFRRTADYKYFSPWNKFFGNPYLLASNVYPINGRV